ncbi:sulfur carrier protein ThiS [Streptomyces sp. 3MP-14]|uniref:Sulfur carrier protein ThiS n=2 Tax=Streptomyces TaxID=1883 RepID=A0A5N6AMP9_9ACTN|nr:MULTISPECIES: sulfur carrier protein ThiS [Streptomyces]KAB8168898.1 sulfur carrier protein ThiS [Streptomyces mimosae]KAB8178246.1 sulfur carrier protein ThiS [Streptomyces sp. 3MP-14]
MTVSVNGEARELPAGTTLAALVGELSGAPTGSAAPGSAPPGTAPSGIAAAVNETVVPRGQWSGFRLAEGDRVEVLTAVQGG